MLRFINFASIGVLSLCYKGGNSEGYSIEMFLPLFVGVIFVMKIYDIWRCGTLVQLSWDSCDSLNRISKPQKQL